MSEHLTQTVAFWNDREAFLFLTVSTTGRSSNAFQEKLAASKYGLLLVAIDPPTSFYKQNVDAYHLLWSGKLERFTLPEQTASYGSWGLREGRLQLTAVSSNYDRRDGFRWDGFKFISVPPENQSQPAAAGSTLTPDDLADDDDDGFLSKAEQAKFKEAGWHYKILSGYAGATNEATLPLEMGEEFFQLTLLRFPPPAKAPGQYDWLAIGAKSMELSGDRLNLSPTVLWSQNGWKEISKGDYLALFQKFGHPLIRPFRTLTWLLLLLAFLLWKFLAWGHVLFSFGTVKKKVLQNLATSYSFPAATPAQFPLLDLEALERYTRELESLGFTRLMDFSLVADRGDHPASFCRLLAHARHRCFAEVCQLFPNGKKPMPMRSSLLSILQDGWTISFSDRKPLATGSLVRRAKAMAVSMPGAGTRELFQSFLNMRDQATMELGISPLTNDTVEAYISQVQRALGEIRQAMQQKNFAFAVPRVYLHKLSMAKTKPEYVWLGDYPREAERRKHGFAVPAGAH